MIHLFNDMTGKPCYAISPSKKATKKELAQIAKAAGEKYFYADCKRHGKGVEHLTSCMKCVACNRERVKQYSEENPDYQKQWREGNPEYHKQYYQDNRKAVSEYQKKYYQSNREACLERQKQYREGNPEYHKQYYQSNREACLERQKKHYQANRAYYVAMTTCQRMGLPQKGLKQQLPYSEEEFTAHIESHWQEGMSWDNYGNGEGCWSIDHIVPVEFFIRVGETDIAVINALNNLQPLWQADNVSKSNNVTIEQQCAALHNYGNAVIF